MYYVSDSKRNFHFLLTLLPADGIICPENHKLPEINVAVLQILLHLFPYHFFTAVRKRHTKIFQAN